MKVIIIVVIVLLLFFLFISYMFSSPKFVRNKIEDKNIEVKWYYHSYLTRNSPDIIDVQKEDEIKQIYRADASIVNVFLKSDTINIRTLGRNAGVTYTKQIDSSVFGYRIIVDTTGTDQEYNVLPRGEKEGWW